MNEEWYNDRIRFKLYPEWVFIPALFTPEYSKTPSQRKNYDVWLNQLISAYQTFIHGKDTTFSRFLSDLPAVPQDVLSLLRDLCVDAERCVS